MRSRLRISNRSQRHLKIYSGEPLSLLGELQVAVKYQTQGHRGQFR